MCFHLYIIHNAGFQTTAAPISSPGSICWRADSGPGCDRVDAVAELASGCAAAVRREGSHLRPARRRYRKGASEQHAHSDLLPKKSLAHACRLLCSFVGNGSGTVSVAAMLSLLTTGKQMPFRAICMPRSHTRRRAPRRMRRRSGPGTTSVPSSVPLARSRVGWDGTGASSPDLARCHARLLVLGYSRLR